MAVSKEQQIEAFNSYWEQAKLECLEAIEFGLEWTIEHAVKDKNNPNIDRVIILKYALPAHMMQFSDFDNHKSAVHKEEPKPILIIPNLDMTQRKP